MALRRQVSRQAMGGKAQSMGSAGFQTILLSPRAGGATTPRPGASPDGAEAALSPSGSSLSLSSPTHKASPGSVSSHTSSTATPTPIDALLKEHLKNLSGQGYGIDDGMQIGCTANFFRCLERGLSVCRGICVTCALLYANSAVVLRRVLHEMLLSTLQPPSSSCMTLRTQQQRAWGASLWMTSSRSPWT